MQNKWAEANLQAYKDYQRQYHADNRDKLRIPKHNARIKSLYGITLKDVQLLREQQGMRFCKLR